MNNLSPIELRPVYHRGHWFVASCRFTDKNFGGLFTEAEGVYLAKATSGLDYPLPPFEFGQFAAAAIRWCREVEKNGYSQF
jgi:hypothetical protein